MDVGSLPLIDKPRSGDRGWQDSTKLTRMVRIKSRNRRCYDFYNHQIALLTLLVPFVVEKKNLNASRPSEHSQQSGGKMSKRVGGIIGCKDKTSSWH